jgi:glycine/D-amino acid oxidase-like deaminating enzyme
MNRPHVARFELGTYELLERLVREHEVPCGWRAVGGVHGFESAEALALAARRIEQLRGSDPDLAATVRLVTAPAELRALRLREDRAVGAVVQARAATCWPYKLVCWVLEGLLPSSSSVSSGFNLQTLTRVEHIQPVSSSSSSSSLGGTSRWIVHTDRGQLTARDVVLATNAYTSRLLPAFTGLIRPVRGQIAALKPPADSSSLAHTHIWAARAAGDPAESEDYLVQRDDGARELILGGERNVVPGGDEGISRDDVINPVISARLHGALRKVLRLRTGGGDDDAGEEEDPKELPADFEWTGIMGYSLDGFPWVGHVPEALGGGGGGGGSSSDGLWIAAGYTGHGMPLAARCGIAVAERLLGRTDGATPLPPEFEISEERVARARAGAAFMPKTLEEELRALVDGFPNHQVT